MQDILRVGVITTTHGIAGEVKVFPTTDDPNRFKKLKKVLLDTGRGMEELSIVQVKFFKNLVILKFQDHNRIEDVMAMKGHELYVTRENAVKLGENENFIADLIGMEVYEENEDRLGILTDVIQTGANDVYAVELEDGREVLIPAIRQCILSVDTDSNKMVVHLLEGLL